MAESMAPASVTWRSPLASTIAAGSAPVAIISAKTSLARRPEIVLSAIRSIKAPSRSADTGDCSMPTPSRFNAPNKSPMTQLAAALASRPAATRSKKKAFSLSATSTPASSADRP